MAAMETLTNSLQCHVCYEDYKVNQRIYQCTSGHSVCQLCRNHLHECPFCKARYEGTRNYAVEEIVREMKVNSNSVQIDAEHATPSQPMEFERAPDDDHVEDRQLSPSYENDHTDSSSSIDDEFSDMVIVTQRSDGNRWIKCTSNDIQSNAIRGGTDHGGEPLYVGRAEHRSALIPGKVHRYYKTCYVPWGGEEHEKSSFEILCNDVDGTWLPNSGGTIPNRAFAAGHTENGETLYIGRGLVAGVTSIGKVQPSHNCCYLPYGGKEYAVQNYEIFVLGT